MQDEDLGFCWADFGDGLTKFDNLLANSISEFHPNAKRLRCNFANVERNVSEIRQSFSFYDKSPGSLKVLFFPQGYKLLNTRWVIFCDKDMVLRKRLDAILDSADIDGVDMVLTVRNNSRFLNTGFMMMRSSSNIYTILVDWVNSFMKRLSVSETDDQTLISLLDLESSFFSDLFVEGQGTDFLRYIDKYVFGQKVRFYTTGVLNNSDPYSPMPDNGYVQHFKGIQFLLIERNLKDIRFFKALLKLMLISGVEYDELIAKLNLWHKFQNQPHFFLDSFYIKSFSFFRYIFLPIRILFPSISDIFK